MITTTLNAIRQTRLLSSLTHAFDAGESDALAAEAVCDGQCDGRFTQRLSPEMLAQILAGGSSSKPDGGRDGKNYGCVA